MCKFGGIRILRPSDRRICSELSVSLQVFPPKSIQLYSAPTTQFRVMPYSRPTTTTYPQRQSPILTGSTMLSQLERPTGRPPGLWQIFSDFGPLYASNGFIAWLFAVTGPVAIILAIGSSGNLSEGEIASWIFGVFFINGLITILFCWLYRQPLAFLWTIPGAVLVGPS